MEIFLALLHLAQLLLERRNVEVVLAGEVFHAADHLARDDDVHLADLHHRRERELFGVRSLRQLNVFRHRQQLARRGEVRDEEEHEDDEHVDQRGHVEVGVGRLVTTRVPVPEDLGVLKALTVPLAWRNDGHDVESLGGRGR